MFRLQPLIAGHGEIATNVWLLFFWAAINATIGYMLGARRGNGAIGAVVSVFFGPLGWLYAALAYGNLVKCPFCSEGIKPDAVVCRYCGRDLPKNTPPVQRRSSLPVIIGIASLGLLVWIIIAALIEGQKSEKRMAALDKEGRKLSRETEFSGSATPTTPDAIRYDTQIHPENIIQDAPASSLINKTTAEAASTPTEMIALTKPVSVQLESSTVTLPVGTELEFVSRVGSEVHVRYI